MKLQDLTGQRFGRLVVVDRAQNHLGRVAWNCRCDCGSSASPIGKTLVNGNTRSCGCLQRDVMAAIQTKHGRYGTPENKAWAGMLKRCRNKKAIDYANYGGRGISVCERWSESFENFYLDVGPKPSPTHSIDRINVNGNYEPGNVRWATPQEQQRNTRRSRVVMFRGESMCLADWGDRVGIPGHAISLRIREGWTVERALTQPLRQVVRSGARRDVDRAV